MGREGKGEEGKETPMLLAAPAKAKFCINPWIQTKLTVDQN